MSNRENAAMAAQASTDARNIAALSARVSLKIMLEFHAIFKLVGVVVAASAYLSNPEDVVTYYATMASAVIFLSLAVRDLARAWKIKV
jgi:hypothetical protein